MGTATALALAGSSVIIRPQHLLDTDNYLIDNIDKIRHIPQ